MYLTSFFSPHQSFFVYSIFHLPQVGNIKSFTYLVFLVYLSQVLSLIITHVCVTTHGNKHASQFFITGSHTGSKSHVSHSLSHFLQLSHSHTSHFGSHARHFPSLHHGSQIGQVSHHSPLHTSQPTPSHS